MLSVLPAHLPVCFCIASGLEQRKGDDEPKFIHSLKTKSEGLAVDVSDAGFLLLGTHRLSAPEGAWVLAVSQIQSMYFTRACRWHCLSKDSLFHERLSSEEWWLSPRNRVVHVLAMSTALPGLPSLSLNCPEPLPSRPCSLCLDAYRLAYRNVSVVLGLSLLLDCSPNASIFPPRTRTLRSQRYFVVILRCCWGGESKQKQS